MTTLEANTKYVNLINHYKMFPPKDGEYFEVHHIVPRAIAPDLVNDKTNLVKLPAEAHFMAHFYLKDMYDSKDKSKMIYAFNIMCNRMKIITEEFALKYADEYAAFRKEFAEEHGKHHSNVMKGHKLSKDTIQKIVNANTGKKRSETTKQKQSEAKLNMSDEKRHEWLENMSKSLVGRISPRKGVHLTDETKKLMSESLSKKRWFNDGIKSYFAEECPEGCVPGRISWKHEKSLTVTE